MRVTPHGRRLRTTLAVASAMFTALVATGAAVPAGGGTSGRVVSFTLTEWKLAPVVATVRPGRVTFAVRNQGTMAHEFVVLRSERHHHQLQVRGGKVVERGRLGRIPTIAVGASKRLTLKLPAGKYVLLCNMLGHYQAGQYAALRVR